MEVETRGRTRHRAYRQRFTPPPNKEPTAVEKVERVYSKKTMRDQFGNYPPWMNSRKIGAQKKKTNGIRKKRAKSASKRLKR